MMDNNMAAAFTLHLAGVLSGVRSNFGHAPIQRNATTAGQQNATTAGHDPLTEQDYQSDDEMPVPQQPCLMAQATTCAQCLSLVFTS
jgi:hypothetical protein